jgi:hypothetical protein
MKLTDDAYAKYRPCKGRKVLCQSQENPVKEWYEKGCIQSKCKYYQAKGESRETPATDII